MRVKKKLVVEQTSGQTVEQTRTEGKKFGFCFKKTNLTSGCRLRLLVLSKKRKPKKRKKKNIKPKIELMRNISDFSRSENATLQMFFTLFAP